ncbi:MAG TPA: aminotransferase class I/II-fold pyridoxal phosphate-dependent enzyme [Baekduia sp.]
MTAISEAQAERAAAARATVAVPYQRPWLPPADAVLAYYRRAEDVRHYSNGGPCARLLEERISKRLGGAACLSFANCTQAISTALTAVAGRPGPEDARLVATPAYTFTATACAIVAAGFEPLFVDVEPAGWQLDPAALEAALAERPGAVAAVLACSTYGTPGTAEQLAAWTASAARHGVPLLVDSAAAFGAADDAGVPTGARGATELFSFHATKPFAIGEGGLLATPDAELERAARSLQNFGLDPVTRLSTAIGVNAKLSELAAATGLAMLDAYDEQLGARRERVAALRSGLDGAPLEWQRGAGASTWQVVPVVAADVVTRDAIMARAEAAGVQVRSPFDPPLHGHPAFAGAARGPLPVSEDLARRTVALPMANDLTADEIAQVVAVVERAL